MSTVYQAGIEAVAVRIRFGMNYENIEELRKAIRSNSPWDSYQQSQGIKRAVKRGWIEKEMAEQI